MSEYKNQLNQPIGFPVEDWQRRPYPPRTSIIGKYCQVEPIDIDAHAEELYQAYGVDKDKSNWTYLPYGPFNDFTEFKYWLTSACSGDDPLFHTVIDLKTNKALGMASFLRIEPAVGVVEVGPIHFSPLMQRTPIATETMYLMMRRVFDELGYRRYEWKCDSLNAPSCTAAKRLGFSFEGIFRQLTMYKGRNRDTAWFAIIDRDWPAMKAAFEAWLDSGNFDESGLQRASLSSFFK
jgi:RimJ/RimL family protein N-acetyltransferase